MWLNRESVIDSNFFDETFSSSIQLGKVFPSLSFSFTKNKLSSVDRLWFFDGRMTGFLGMGLWLDVRGGFLKPT
jgi:hypothetical protein